MSEIARIDIDDITIVTTLEGRTLRCCADRGTGLRACFTVELGEGDEPPPAEILETIMYSIATVGDWAQARRDAAAARRENRDRE